MERLAVLAPGRWGEPPPRILDVSVRDDLAV